ncbi:jasmonate-induced oxygenase 2-like [Magnolia sinica]|uniref:jasmonate-induced oxygenase 2-like n=1 Tax=Magnolia sinica TaxID=86752 RepID=UPI00265A63E4|nr:jasmonate-induced oxygenase 2-like [Magnolia sinica]
MGTRLNMASMMKVIGEYGERVVELCKKLLRLLGEELGIGEECLLERFGGEEGLAACFRINYYPNCPQHELAIGLSPHTDPGIFTAIFQNDVSGLQVFKDGIWISVPPTPDALLFIIADQLEILSNGIYKSVNHRTPANGDKERMSMVVFFNPEGNKKIGPMDILVERCGGLRLYNDMTFNDHRKLIRTLGVRGKAILDSRSTTKDSVLS